MLQKSCLRLKPYGSIYPNSIYFGPKSTDIGMKAKVYTIWVHGPLVREMEDPPNTTLEHVHSQVSYSNTLGAEYPYLGK